MKSLNNTVSIIFFLIFYTVCVICPGDKSDEELCEEAIALEYDNGTPYDDFLHGLMTIKLDAYVFNPDTGINEEIFRGQGEQLNKLVHGYYSGLFLTALDVGLPYLPTPLEFCATKHGDKLDDCLSVIEENGCRAHIEGSACLENLYFYWSKPYEPHQVEGTEGISDENLLEAILSASDAFRNLSEEELIEAIYDDDIVNSMSDRQLLKDHGFSRRNYFRYGEGEPPINQQHYEYMEYQTQYGIQLKQARLNRYGIANVSYDDLCEEYIRRRNASKAYCNFYVNHLIEIINGCNDDPSESILITRTEYCEKYVSEQD